MAKLEVCAQDVQAEINALKMYRSGWANDIREGWNCSMDGAKEISYELYEISGTIILALEDVLCGCYRSKMAMIMTEKKLQELVNSERFHRFSVLGECHACSVITTSTKHHIRAMLEDLKILTR